MQVTCKILVYGRVQGVYFRQSARDRARELGVDGTVRNCADGSVEIIATGEKEKIEELYAWCKRGPDRAKVERADMHEHPLKKYEGFTITY
jgi:acylphosphatase